MLPVNGEVQTALHRNREPTVFRDLEDLHLIKKLTVQMYLLSIKNCKMDLLNPNKAAIVFETKENSVFYFVVKRTDQRRRHQNLTTSLDHIEDQISMSERKLQRKIYCAGLDTASMSPSAWCLRVSETIAWKLRENLTWLTFGRCLYETHKQYFQGENIGKQKGNGWLTKSSQRMRQEYKRIGVDAPSSGWAVSEDNSFFAMCSTYPQVIAFPTSITPHEMSLAAELRSKNRVPALVWIHPYTKVSIISIF